MKTFDYIIIGAGSSGSILANRLSKNPNTSVLLLEAGGKDRSPYIHMPGGYAKIHKSKNDWGFWTEPQTFINNRKLYLPRGKVLGGCSSTNAMAYVRGNRNDYNNWSDLGNNGWSYEELLPYFKRSENNFDIDKLDSDYHGAEGELSVGLSDKFETKYAEIFIEACGQYGIKRNKDYNGQIQKGASRFQHTIKDGKRQSAATAFLKPILHRSNLTISTESFVQKINIKNDRATGVTYTHRKDIIEVRASKEVILSAGTFQSPQILNLSGIGEESELAKHNISTILDLPGVGKNLQDHLFYGISALTKNQDGINRFLTIGGQLKALFEYVTTKGGPLASGPLESVAFINVDDPDGDINHQFHFAPLNFGKGYDTDVYDMKTFPTEDGVMIAPTLLYPKSRGSVSLASDNPFDHPIIQPNFLSESEDIDNLLSGGKIALEILKQEAFESHLSEIIAPPKYESEEDLIAHIKAAVETVYHPVGTCKMGIDDMAVVDENLRVKGLENLRVIDASVMPQIVGGNTNAACFVIAEKAADMILHPAKLEIQMKSDAVMQR